MHRVFVSDECMADGRIVIKGDQAHHISRSLRMKKGEKITVVVNGTAYDCTLSGFTGETVTAEIVAPAAKTCEPPSRITLFQAITKSDSDSIVRRAVECGASKIVFFTSRNCTARPGDGYQSRLSRLNRISREAAEQCGRDIIPEVTGCPGFDEALKSAEGLILFCYEGNGTVHISEAVESNAKKTGVISLFIGSEGGFTPDEVKRASEAGAFITGLGPRILRAETASSFALAAISCLIEK